MNVFTDNLLNRKKIPVEYTQGFFTSFTLEFQLNAYDNVSNARAVGITGYEVAYDDKEYSDAKKYAGKYRSILLSEIKKDPVTLAYVYLSRSLCGATAVVFRVVSPDKQSRFDITFKDEDVFGVPFDKVDPVAILQPLFDNINSFPAEGFPYPNAQYGFSDDRRWIIVRYDLTAAKFKKGLANKYAQGLGRELFGAMKSTRWTYDSAHSISTGVRKAPYYLAGVFLGMGMQVELLNKETKEVDYDQVPAGELIRYCEQENYTHRSSWSQQWKLSVPGFLSAEAKEYDDAFTLELWSTWYDLLGGVWNQESITAVLKEDPGQIVSKCIESGKPLQVTIRSRFGYQIGGVFTPDELAR